MPDVMIDDMPPVVAQLVQELWLALTTAQTCIAELDREVAVLLGRGDSPPKTAANSSVPPATG